MTCGRNSADWRMRLVLLLGAVGILLAPALSRAGENGGYGYPIPGSFEATILGTPESLKPPLPKEIPSKSLALEIIPDQKKPPIFFYDEGLRCTVAFQKRKAPLVFLIAGTGSSSRASKIETMMKYLYQAGYHVVALPSPTHPNFIISASASHIPGDLVEDAADLYRAMQAVMASTKGKIDVSAYDLAGYSLGGTQAAFVAKLDEERKAFNFRKVLMINPAVNLYRSVLQIEGLLDKIPGGPAKIGSFFNQMLGRFVDFYREGDFVAINDEFLYAVYKAKLLTEHEAGGLIGLSFRINSAGMIFTTDVMTNSGYIVPKNRVLSVSDPLDDYFRVGVHLSFIQYFDEFLLPYVQGKRPGLTREAYIEAEGLGSIAGYLQSSPKFGVMANDNDFILAPGDLDRLRTLFGDRLKVYPRGGHLGNLEYRDNMAYMADFVGFLSEPGGTLP